MSEFDDDVAEEESESMSEEEFANIVKNMFDEFYECDYNFPELENNRARTFDDVGMLTYNKGVVVDLFHGSQFQLTIVRSR